MTSVFESYKAHVFPYNFKGRLRVTNLAGGIPSDPKVAEGWLRSKMFDKNSNIRAMVNEVIESRDLAEAVFFDDDGDVKPDVPLEGEGAKEVSAELIAKAIPLAAALKHVNGFKRDKETKELYIEGRQLKAGLKEAAMVAANAGNLSTKGWGNPDNAAFRKGLKGWFPEHVFVVEDRLYLGRDVADALEQRFVHTHRGTGIQYEELVYEAEFDFTITTDYDFSEKDWATIWCTGQEQGIGASRSQGFGRYEVIQWEPLKGAAKTAVQHKTRARAAA